MQNIIKDSTVVPFICSIKFGSPLFSHNTYSKASHNTNDLKLNHWIMQCKSFHWLNHHGISEIIIQLSYTVEIPIFRLADLYHVMLGCDETTSLTSLSWCNSRGVHSTHHCHYTMALDCKTAVFFANASDGSYSNERSGASEKRRGRMVRDAKKYGCPPWAPRKYVF